MLCAAVENSRLCGVLDHLSKVHEIFVSLQYFTIFHNDRSTLRIFTRHYVLVEKAPKVAVPPEHGFTILDGFNFAD